MIVVGSTIHIDCRDSVHLIATIVTALRHHKTDQPLSYYHVLWGLSWPDLVSVTLCGKASSFGCVWLISVACKSRLIVTSCQPWIFGITVILSYSYWLISQRARLSPPEKPLDQARIRSSTELLSYPACDKNFDPHLHFSHQEPTFHFPTYSSKHHHYVDDYSAGWRICRQPSLYLQHLSGRFPP